MRGLYIHIPFCLKKCKYCDFNSFTFSCEDKKSYLSALFQQMEQYKGEPALLQRKSAFCSAK